MASHGDHQQSNKQTTRLLKGRVKSTKNKSQTTLHGDTLRELQAQEWGDTMTTEAPPMCSRIGFQNVGPQRTSRSSDHTKATMRHIAEGQYDAFLFAEHSTNWWRIEPLGRWHMRLQDTIDMSTTQLAFNEHVAAASPSAYLAGGTGVSLLGDIAHRKNDQGKDETLLGRWSWIKITGKQRICTILVSAYRPVRNETGPLSTWNQHLQYLRARDDPRTPHEAFDDDLLETLQGWLDAGHHIILGMDQNDDVRRSSLTLKLKAAGMMEQMTQSHPSKVHVATYNRNRSGVAIDGIWTTPMIGIKRCGYLPFDVGCPSDHRVVWMDVLSETILGHRPPRILRPVMNRLNSKDPRQVAKYCFRVNQQYSQQRLPQRMEQLRMLVEAYQMGQLQLWEVIVQEYNQIHNETTRIRFATAKHIRKVRRGQIPWSPRLKKFRDQIDLWKRVVKLRQGVTTSRTTIRRLTNRLDLPRAQECSLDEALCELKLAYKAYKEARKNAANWRSDHQEALADAMAKQNKTSQAQEIKNMRRIERQKYQGRCARRIRTSQLKKPVTMVQIETADGERQSCENQTTIVAACAESNLQRQLQAQDTPFLNYPLVQDVGYLAERPAAEAILAGTYQLSPHLSEHTRAFIRALRKPTAIQQKGNISVQIPLQDHQRAWRKQREHTASEPTSLSFSHYKLSAKDDIIGLMDAQLRQWPLQLGFVPDLWTQITDVEILKKPNEYRVDKMRLIQLMAADFNLNNKMIGSRMMYQAETAGTLADDQHGSRKRRKAIVAALHKRLVMDLWRQQRRAGAICMNDAKSCYDRIVHSVAILALRRQGVPRTACQCLFGTLQAARHCISTGFGVSEPVYGGPEQDPPVQGAGQGSGKAPAIWAAVSTVIISMMYAAGYGMEILSSLTGILLRLVCFAFVDDTDTLQSAPTVEWSGEQVVPRIQAAVDCWEGGLWTSGGSIVPDKSFWYLVDFRWTPRGWEYRSKEEMEGQLTVKDNQRNRVVLRRLDPHEATTTLGVRMAMSGDPTSQIEELRGKSQAFGDSIRTAVVSKSDAWFTLQASFFKTLEYPTLACSLSRKEWEHVMAPALKYALPKCGLARNFPRSVLFGPKSHQGLGLVHPYFRQHILQLQLWYEVNLAHSTTADLLRATLEGLLLELGMSTSLGQTDFARFGKLISPNCWWGGLWEFLWTNNLDIAHDTPTPPLLRQHDQYLMDVFGRDQQFSPSQLRRINECRMYLHAVTIADITTMDGCALCKAAVQGSIAGRQTLREIQWPRQPCALPPSSWTLWRKALRTFCQDSYLLNQPLGPWTHTGTLLSWKWWIPIPQNSRNVVYHHSSAQEWETYVASTQRRGTSARRGQHAQQTQSVFRRCHRTTTQVPNLTCRLVPVSIRTQTTETVGLEGRPATVSFRPASLRWAPTVRNRRSSDILSHRHAEESLKEWLQRVTQANSLIDVVTATPDAEHHLRRAAITGSLQAVSDGSYQDDHGTAAWVLEDGSETMEHLVCGVNWVTGDPKSQTSFRSELFGVAGILVCADLLRQLWQLPRLSVEIGLDGQSAIDAIQSAQGYRASQTSVDILQVLRNYMTSIDVTWRWVEGHQCERYGRRLQDLDWWGKANEGVDQLAKQHLHHQMRQDRPTIKLQLPKETFCVFHEKVPLTSLQFEMMYSDLMVDEICTYWKKKHAMSWDMVNSIDWVSIQRAVRALPLGMQRWYSKFASGHCGVGIMEEKRGHQSHSRCPRCQHSPETTQHVTQCRAASATTTWSLALTRFHQDLDNVRTAPWLSILIFHVLQQWRHNRAIALPAGYQDRLYNGPFVDQFRIPWWNFLLGRLVTTWADSQAVYLLSLQSKISPQRWASTVIKQLILLSWDLWSDRNNALHGPTGRIIQERTTKVDAELRAIYRQGTAGLPPSEYHWLDQPLPRLLQQPLPVKEQWILAVATARRFFAIRPLPRPPTSPAVQRQQTLMRNWLQPPPFS